MNDINLYKHINVMYLNIHTLRFFIPIFVLFIYFFIAFCKELFEHW